VNHITAAAYGETGEAGEKGDILRSLLAHWGLSRLLGRSGPIACVAVLSGESGLPLMST
jgi:hypothetical protein